MWIPEHRTLSLSYVDPVVVWKHAALKHARLAEQARQHATKRFISVRMTLGFAALAPFTQLFALQMGVEHALAAAVVLPSMVLVQELPRAVLARVMGRSSRIQLAATGSQTELIGTPLRGPARLAFDTIGSLANLLVALAIFGVCRIALVGVPAALQMIAAGHAGWGLGQVLPLVPFRAGHCIGERLRPALRFAHASLSVVVLSLSMALASGSAWAFAIVPGLALAILGCWRQLGQAHAESLEAQSGALALAARAEEALSHAEPALATDAAQKGLAAAQSLKLQVRLRKALAWSAIAASDPFLAHHTLELLPGSELDVHLVAAYLNCCNRLDDAASLLAEARAHGHRSRETTKLWIDVLYRSGKHAAARALAEAERELLSADDWQAIQAVC